MDEPSLFERVDETNLVDSLLDGVMRTHSGSALVLSGPAGIGKTSMLRRARTRAEELGFVVTAARGVDLEQDYAWGVVLQMFGSAAQTDAMPTWGSGPAGLARELIAGVHRSDSPARGDYALIHSLYWMTSDLATGRPLLIIADDLHWADVSSLRFLAYISARLGGLPVALIAATRQGADRVDHILSVIGDGPDTTVRELSPLTGAGTADMLASVLELDPESELVARCYEVTRGNPLLVHEVAQHIAANGDIQAANAILDSPIPGVAQYVQVQLQHLPRRAIDVMRGLAVLGDLARLDRIAAVADLPTAQVLSSLTVLIDAELVTADDVSGLFSISHPLIRAAVYDAIAPASRNSMHTQAAAVFGPSDTEKAATHLLRVSPGSIELDVVAILNEAAQLCLARGAVESAVAYLRRELDEDLGDDRPMILSRLGIAEGMLGDQQAVSHLKAAIQVEEDAERRAVLALALVEAIFRADGPADAWRACIAVLPSTSGASHSAKLALRASAELMLNFMSADNRLPVQVLADKYGVDTSPGGRMLEAAFALRSAFEGRRDDAETRALRCLGGGDLFSDPVKDSTILFLLGPAWATLCYTDSVQAMPSLDAAIEKQRSSGFLRPHPAYCWRANVMYNRGNLEGSIGDARLGLEVGLTSASSIPILWNTDILVRALLARGQLSQASTVFAQVKDYRHLALGHVVANAEISFFMAQGDYERALVRVEQLRLDHQLLGIRNPAVVDWRGHRIQCLHFLGRDEEAWSLVAEMRAMAEHWGAARMVGRSLRVAAIVAPAGTQLELLCESVRILADSSAKLELAHSTHALGEALGSTRHVSEARRHLQTALDLAELCGAKPLTRRIASDMRLMGMRPISRTGLETLTPAERRVAELAAEGLSNKEIAQALFVTVKTVEAHLGAAFRKLRIKRRQELAYEIESQ